MTEEARLYGTVLYELEVPQEMVKKTGEILGENPELVRVLQSPVYRREKKHAIIEEIWKTPEYSSVMTKFLKKACDAGAIGQFPDIVKVREECERLADGVLTAQLWYVTAPDETQMEGIRQFLKKTYGKREVRLSLASHPELMGGFVLKTGDVEYDYSLLGKLKKLSQAVAG
ncbi:ATP synthase F1 subunit delta [Brotaphodocola sp.]|uniref:ATP synthase F1 subunit delta n=1 Tax=Brotaphodocola sp. TaxID=3073577 RepID=UPI003D7DA7D8